MLGPTRTKPRQGGGQEYWRILSRSGEQSRSVTWLPPVLLGSAPHLQEDDAIDERSVLFLLQQNLARRRRRGGRSWSCSCTCSKWSWVRWSLSGACGRWTVGWTLTISSPRPSLTRSVDGPDTLLARGGRGRRKFRSLPLSLARRAHMKIWTSSSRPLPDSSCSVSASLVRQWMHVHALVLEAFWKNFTQFLRARAIRFEFGHYSAITWYLAPACSEECRNIGVSGRLFHELFLRSLVSDSNLFGAGPAEKNRNLFWEMTSGADSAFLDRQWLRAHASVYRFGEIARFSTCRWTSDREVDTLRCAMPGSTVVTWYASVWVLMDVFLRFFHVNRVALVSHVELTPLS